MPTIDLLVIFSTNIELLSFVDGFSSYNQILIAVEDISKTFLVPQLYRNISAIGHAFWS